jgi:hypothetical protein
MAWVKVESSVARHRKFLQAGPAPSWLWLCGLAYCQEGLTDGFIPVEALPHLGVGKNTGHLVDRLVKARLWDVVDGGWRVHDYLEHNRSAEKVRGIKTDRREAGARGGEASGEARREARLKQSAAANAKQVANPSVAVAAADGVAVAAVVEGGSGETTPSKPIGARDVWFRELYAAYPPNRRMRGRLVEEAFNEIFAHDPRPDESVWSDMWMSLQSAIAGYEWRVKGMVPAMDKWLTKDRCFQRFEPAPVSAIVSDKTARALTSAEAFIKAGER